MSEPLDLRAVRERGVKLHGYQWTPAEHDRADLLSVLAATRQALRASIANHCRDDRMYCSTCAPARAALALAVDPEETEKV